MRQHWNRFLDTLSFMTTIRVRAGGFDENFHRAVMFFPTIGLILGILYQVVQSITLPWFGPFASAVMVVASAAVLTGGLHLDGLGDTFDGVYSYRSREKILEIMKDSRIGTNGLLAVLFVILLKIAVLFKLLDYGYNLVFFMPLAGRTISLLACFIGRPAKSQGSGNAFIGKVPRLDFIIGMTTSLLYLGIFSQAMGIRYLLVMNLMAMAATIVFAILYLRHIRRRIGGITGDVLGAVCELAEMMYLIFICLEVTVFWNSI